MKTVWAIAISICASATLHAAPPPPGWAEAYQARVCGTAAPSIPIKLMGETITEKAAGIRLPSHGPARFGWAVEFSVDEAQPGRPVGIGFDRNYGLVLATDRGMWLQISDPKRGLAGSLGGRMITIGDGTKPLLQANSIGGGVFFAVLQDARSIVQYDIGTCGFGAKAQPEFHLPPDQEAKWIGLLSPAMSDPVSGGHYLLVGGKGPNGYGEIAGASITGDPVISLRAPFTPPSLPISKIFDYDIEGGCDAVMITRSTKGGSDLQTYCSKQFSDRPLMLTGDTALRVVRSTPGIRSSVGIAKMRDDVVGATEAWSDDGRSLLLLLTEPDAGKFRIVAITSKFADYKVGG